MIALVSSDGSVSTHFHGLNTRMFPFYFSIGLAICSITLYHVFQKLISSSVNPMLALTVTFSTASLICLVLFFLHSPAISLRESLRQLNWASFALAFAVVGTEVGFLLAYRTGWNISLGALVANLTVSLMLLPIGLWFFDEHLSAVNMVGILVCAGGLLLISYR